MLEHLLRVAVAIALDRRGETRCESRGVPRDPDSHNDRPQFRERFSTGVREAREGVYPDYGLERIVAYHERQDARFAQAAADISDATGKPVLTATELAVAFPDNPGPATVRATGRLCYASANRAVTALGHLWRYAQFRRARGYI